MVTMSLSSEFHLHWRLIMKTSTNLCIGVILRRKEKMLFEGPFKVKQPLLSTVNLLSVFEFKREMYIGIYENFF